MDQTQTILINEWWFVALIAAAFAYLGMRRGLTIELTVLVSIILGILFADWLAKFSEPWVNVFYQLVMAIVREHVYSPDKVFALMPKQPRLITIDFHRTLLGTALFALVVATGFLVGHKRSAKARPPRLTTAVLAAAAGAVNGYLVAYFLFPRHITVAKTIIEMPSAPIRDLLQIQLGIPIFITVLVLVTLGVLGTRQHSKAKDKS